MARKLLAAFCALVYGLVVLTIFTLVDVPYDSDAGILGNGCIQVSNATIAGVVLLVVTVICIAGYVRARTRRKEWARCPCASPSDRDTRFLAVCIVVPVCLLALQMLVVLEAGITTGWDAGGVEDVALLGRVRLPHDGFSSWYFSRAPNNLFLLWLLRGICKLRRIFVPFAEGKLFLSFATCVLSCIACFFFMRIADRLLRTRRHVAWATALYIALVGLSPWYMIPYSDSFSLPVCMATLWCFVCGRSPWVRWALPGVLAVVGYAIKPTALLIFVAMLLVSALDLAALPQPVVLACKGGMVVIGLVVGMLIVSGARASLPIKIDEEGQFTMLHYSMMGLNVQTDGKYSEDDVLRSLACETVAERERMNQRVIDKRLAAMGDEGLRNLLYRKLLFAYNNGAFAWNQEGNFIVTRVGYNNPLSQFLVRYLYEDGEYYGAFCAIQQTFWLVTLIGIPLGALGLRYCGTRLKWVAAMLASILMVTVFVLIFEVRARYLFLYGGYFVLLASWGYESLFTLVRAKGHRRAV